MHPKTVQELLEIHPTAEAEFNEQGECIALYCLNCSNLTSLPDMPLLKSLSCYNCINLTSLPNMPLLTYLHCLGCRSLVALSDMPLLTYLDCSDCSSLTGLPDMPLLIILNCYNCSSLTGLPDMPLLTKLRCSGCSLLVALSDMPSLTRLNCSGCHLLKVLPDTPSLTELNCFDIPALDSIIKYQSKKVTRWTEKWRRLHLMPKTKEGILVWKHVSPTLLGNLGFQYEIGKSFTNDGMACAGPFGALQTYNEYPENTHIIAILATKLSPVNIKKGIYYIYEGTPIALYKASDIDANGATMLLIDGVENLNIKKILYAE